MSTYLFERIAKFKVLNFVIALMAIFHFAPVYAQKSSLKTYKNPSAKAMRLHGDVSCMKIYYNHWSTKFGERVDDEPTLKQVLYFDSEHRLVCLEEMGDFVTKAKYEAGDRIPVKIYVYEYESDANGNLKTIDCYESTGTFVNYFLQWRMRLVKENGVIVANKYNGSGYELKQIKPYNATIQGILSVHLNIDSDDYVFAFEMESERLMSTFADEKNKSKVRATYYYKYNNNNQLVKLSGTADAGGLLNAYFNYDDKGNLAVIDIHSSTLTGTGNKWTFEYTYGDFEESAKHSMAYREEEKRKKEERERAIKDSIKVAKAEEREYQRMRRDSLAKVREKEAEMQRIMRDSILKAKQQEYMEQQKKAEKKAKKERIKRKVGNIFKSILGDCRKEEFDVEDYLNKEVTCSEQIYLKDGREFFCSEYFKSSGGVVIFDTDYGDMQLLGLG